MKKKNQTQDELDRRKAKDRRKGTIDEIYYRLVARKLLVDRRKGDRRDD